MGEPGYAYAPYPWRAAIGLRTRGPALLYADLVNRAMRYGAPVGGRADPLRRALGRRPPPAALLRTVLRVLPRRPRPDLDRLALDLFAAWPRLVAGLEGAPAEPGELDLLALERKSARTVFVFAGGDDPIVVAKIPHASPTPIENEVAALQTAAGAGGAPRYLGTCGGAYVQQAIPGHALRVRPLRVEDCATLPWSRHHEAMCSALLELKVGTRVTAPPREPVPERARQALDHPRLPARTAASVREALEVTGSFGVSVLKHGDLSPQNCLYIHHRFSGIVDWESAIPNGTPGFDTLNSGAAEIEHRLALRAIGPAAYGEAMSAAWRMSPFFDRIRNAIAAELDAVGLTADDVRAVAISFFARRLGHRMAAPHRYAAGEEAALRTLIDVCAQDRASSR